MLLERATSSTKLKRSPLKKLLAETLLELLTEKVAKIGEINLNFLGAAETSDEASEAEIFKQDEFETERKSLMKSIQKWITEHTSDVDETSTLGSIHRDNVRLPRKEFPSFDAQY